MKTAILLSWSGGKDSALSLEIIHSKKHSVKALLTTMTEGFDRTSIRGVRRSLLEAQASSLGLPVVKVWIPKNASNETYETRIKDVC
ncbi:MAG: hypothetical protein JRN33_07205 [Nitrososphaerota archaeon]|nr:hypothetical protein [Nitrososphaerota archaeon]